MVEKAVVLIVDDDAATRELERRIVETGPYQILEASDATGALAILDSGQRVDLMISDLEMPGLSGEELAKTARVKRPDLKVLYVSGVVDRLLKERKVLDDNEAFVDKPFTPTRLLETISLLLYGTLSPPIR